MKVSITLLNIITLVLHRKIKGNKVVRQESEFKQIEFSETMGDDP